MQQRRFILGTFGAAALITLGAALAPAAHAQSFPSKTIKFVVPFGPGSGTDTSARYFARKLQDLTGQAVVVENKPGGSGNIGADAVAKLTQPWRRNQCRHAGHRGDHPGQKSDIVAVRRHRLNKQRQDRAN